jgi:hypothetical protein
MSTIFLWAVANAGHFFVCTYDSDNFQMCRDRFPNANICSIHGQIHVSVVSRDGRSGGPWLPLSIGWLVRARFRNSRQCDGHSATQRTQRGKVSNQISRPFFVAHQPPRLSLLPYHYTGGMPQKIRSIWWGRRLLRLLVVCSAAGFLPSFCW